MQLIFIAMMKTIKKPSNYRETWAFIAIKHNIPEIITNESEEDAALHLMSMGFKSGDASGIVRQTSKQLFTKSL